MAIPVRMCSRLMRSFVKINPATYQNKSSNRCYWRLLTTTATDANSSPQEPKETKTESTDDVIIKMEQSFNDEKEKLSLQLADSQDKYKRSLAETENVRQRMKKQIDDAKLFGIQGFCKDLIDVADILGKATESVPPEMLTDQNSHLKGLYDGLTMTELQLQKVFTRHGLEKINPTEGEKFNPNFHEALFQSPVIEGREPGTIATVTKLGYRLHSRTLRPALVGVFKEA